MRGILRGGGRMKGKYKPLYPDEHGEDPGAYALSSIKIRQACAQKTPTGSKVDGLFLELTTS
jgi:hypothetical protein